jgi:outer membrane protein Pom
MILVAGRCDAQSDITVQLNTGYEQQNFRWSIAGNSAGRNPNVYSELKWQAVRGITSGIDLRWQVMKRWYIYASGSRTFIHWGRMTDTDYGLDNRNDELYHQQFSVTSGYNQSVSGAIGYSLIKKGQIRLVPYIGYGIDKQYFPITNTGLDYAQLNSTYSARWPGPFAGAELICQFSGHWTLSAQGTYDQVLYRASADWNLIPEFAHPVSFRHHANGFVARGTISMDYQAGKHISVIGRTDYFDRETGTGIDELYLNSGKIQQTQLNGVHADGFGIRLTVQWRL